MRKTWLRVFALATLAVMLFGMLPAYATDTATHVHQWGAWILDKAATCTEDGNEHRICSAPNCPQPNSREDKTIARLGHSFINNWSVTKGATCDATGTEIRYCANGCGTSETGTIPVLGHDWGPWNVTTAATCTTGGSQTRTCRRDTAHTETQAIAALDHAWGAWNVTTPATCVKAGSQTRVCSRDASHKETTAIKALGPNQPNGHRFGDWKPTKEATCLVKGQESRTCLDCGRVETRETKLGKHVAKPGWFARPAPTLQKKGTKVQYCAVCDKIIAREEYGLKGYTYEMPALNFGPRAKELYTPLEQFRDRFTPLDLSQDGETIYPLITEDGYYIADLHVVVLQDTLTVTYVMKDPETVVNNEILLFFEDANAVTAADLSNVSATHRYGEVIQLGGKTYLVMDARLLVNYNQEHNGNRPFSDNGVYIDGLTQNAVILQEMTTKLTTPAAI